MDLRYDEIELAAFDWTRPEAFGVTSDATESADNTCPGNWMPFVSNPWIDPRVFVPTDVRNDPNFSSDRFVEGLRVADRNQTDEMDDDEWVGRSSAALRDWMNENPF